ncbi:MAG: AAA family ATPase [Betaproteobacteria bacterium]|nr:AAA family ATPase [Betaproteobacteria bacterium]
MAAIARATTTRIRTCSESSVEGLPPDHAVSLHHTRLLELVEYVVQSTLQRQRVVANVRDHASFVLHEQQLAGIEGLRTNVPAAEPDEAVWLCLARPGNPQLPPKADSPWLAPWLEIGHASLAAPRLADTVSGDTLIAAGTHRDAAAAGANLSEITMPAVRGDEQVSLADYAFRDEVERQFAAYLQDHWTPWAEADRARRRSSRLYMQLVTLHQELTGIASDGLMELVWGTAVVTGPGSSYPLLVQPVDISVDAGTGLVTVRPRNADVRLELDAHARLDKATAARIERAAGEFHAAADLPFSPFEPATFEPVVELARQAFETAASPEGQVYTVEPGWVLFARPRNTTPLLQDLERFAGQLRNGDSPVELPAAVSMLVADPAAEVPDGALPRYRGISTFSLREESGTTRDLYFPLPFNDEQMRIVQLLESREGVIVQGPPGTGKTHTIANIICHWLCHGRRVLVTSMKEPALAVLREKLPEELQPLVLSLLTGDQGGMQSLEHAVEDIAARVQSLDTVATGQDIARLEEEIDAMQARLARIDDAITADAHRQLAPILLDGESIDPLDAATTVAAELHGTDWLPDALGTASRFDPRFDDTDLSQLFSARERLGDDVVYARQSLPDTDQLPGPEALLDAHRRLVRLAQLARDGRSSDTPVLAAASPETHALLQGAARIVARVRELRGELAGETASWWPAVAARLVGGVTQSWTTLEELGSEIDETAAANAGIATRPVSLPPGAEFDTDLAQAVRNLASGKRAFGLTTLFRPEARSRLASIHIDEHLPGSPADWKHVADALALRARWRALSSRWNALAPELDLPKVSTDDARGIGEAVACLALVRKARALRTAETDLSEAARALFPGWSLARRLAEEPAAIRGLERALDHYLNAQQLADVWQVRSQLRDAVGTGRGGVFDALATFARDRLGHPDVPDDTLVAEWFALLSELKRVQDLAQPLATVARVAAAVEASGAPRLAEKLRTSAGVARESLVPADWRHGWRVRRLATHLRQVDAGVRILELSAQRSEIEQDLARAYRALVVHRAWLRLAEKATPGVRSALQAYLSALQRMGKGTGKRAARYRQDARDSAALAQAAVPCWIMPHHRISESLPSQFGAFDLVVIDEASQSDLSALPALLRGTKMLVVGDDKQVSPDPVGVDEERIRTLMQRCLGSQVPIYRMQMSPERSIYDLARVVFASNGVMLKEHFRCVAPIIEYSKREFYGDELRPLRLPLRSRRLDPPLVDVRLEGATRVGDINAAEADYIVGEIARATADPRMQGRTIGVVSLLGEDQAARIREQLADRLGPATMQAYAIECGDAKAFQGRERDVIYLSMVVAPNAIGAPLSRETFAQRFNVAASRARDRMVLVRSVGPEQLSEADWLRHGLMGHFRAPFGEVAPEDVPLRDRCETVLERALYDELAERGYRVLPRVQVGTYQIDLVIEGAGDTRMAVECDGDRRVGAAHWIDDIRRQRVLERAGWEFRRCFATRYILERDAVLAELESALAAHGIRPTRNGAPAEAGALTEHRVVRAAEASATAGPLPARTA